MSQKHLKITELGPKADGIAESSKGPVFVELTAPGDEVEAVIFRDKQGVARGEVKKFLSLSPYRAKPPCPHYEVCGNCTLQHVSADFYQSWKQHLVKTAFDKWGVKPKQWLPPVFIGGHNRRRATFSFSVKKGKRVMGYYQRRSKNISPIPSCEIALPELMELKNSVEPILSSWIREGEILDVFFQKIGNQFEIVFSGLTAVPKSVITELSSFPSIGRISLRTERGIQVLLETKKLNAKFGKLSVHLPPASFLQPTQEGEEALVQGVLNAAKASLGSLADLFCGAGTFTGPLLSLGEVSAFESNPHAVKALRDAGKKEKLQVKQRDLFSHPLSSKELKQFDTVVFDPPRAGCLEQCKELARSRCPSVIGVSCNPATFARDANALIRGGYQLKTLQLVDQFLWSHHVEAIGVFAL